MTRNGSVNHHGHAFISIPDRWDSVVSSGHFGSEGYDQLNNAIPRC